MSKLETGRPVFHCILYTLYIFSGKRACVGYEDGVVKLWDLKTGDIVHTFSGRQSSFQVISEVIMFLSLGAISKLN